MFRLVSVKFKTANEHGKSRKHSCQLESISHTAILTFAVQQNSFVEQTAAAAWRVQCVSFVVQSRAKTAQPLLQSTSAGGTTIQFTDDESANYLLTSKLTHFHLENLNCDEFWLFFFILYLENMSWKTKNSNFVLRFNWLLPEEPKILILTWKNPKFGLMSLEPKILTTFDLKKPKILTIFYLKLKNLKWKNQKVKFWSYKTPKTQNLTNIDLKNPKFGQMLSLEPTFWRFFTFTLKNLKWKNQKVKFWSYKTPKTKIWTIFYLYTEKFEMKKPKSQILIL